MPYSKHFLSLALSVVFLGTGVSRSFSADPSNEPMPTVADSQSIGFSTPELTDTPEPMEKSSDSFQPAPFPYGAPLVGYEAARTCWPHRYCECLHSDYKSRSQCRAWGYPEYFCERPFGSYTRSFLHRQVANGLSNQLAIYHFDFFDTDTDRADQLKPRGVRQVVEVARIASMLYDENAVVTVETTGDDKLDHRRRLQVFETLSEIGSLVALDQVVTGIPKSLGLAGDEAVEIFEKQMQLGAVASEGDGSNTAAQEEQ